MARIHRPIQKGLHDPGLHDLHDHTPWCDHSPRDRHPNCEVKWALGSITSNKASGGDGIPVELFQILKHDAVKVLYSVCKQVWKTQQWPQDWKRSVYIPVPKKGNAKDVQTIAQLQSSHMPAK